MSPQGYGIIKFKAHFRGKFLASETGIPAKPAILAS